MRSVLIADDDGYMVQTLCDVLTLHGWSTTGVSSGEEALEVSAENPYSCILMDIKMEGQDGFSTMQRIKRRDNATPVFLMTAYTADELMAEVRRNGTLQAVNDMMPVADTADDIVRANNRGDSVVVLSRRQGFLDSLHDVLQCTGIPVVKTDEGTDLLAEFEREPPGVTFVRIPPAQGPADNGYMITGLDAGVWVALSSQLPHLASVLSHAVTLADGFFRKPLAIPQLVEHLNAVVVG